MRETGKTVTYVGVALLLGVVTILARPKEATLRGPDIRGKVLFEKFTDPTKAASLQIVRYAEDVGEVHTFEVAKNSTNGLWTIPSHGNYPADAQDQMKQTAMSLVGLTVLDVASEDRQDHEMFGVVEPNKEKLKPGDKGVGLLVAFRDEKGDNLARLIIGQQVKGSTDQRFVRIPGQDPVYVAKITPEKLSTKFEDWIEKDLLKISTWDVERLRLKDYSVVPSANGYLLQPRSEIAVSFVDNKWQLDQMLIGPKSQKSELLEGEELDKEKLDAVKTALSDVKIVDVYPKPKGLTTTLKASGDFANDAEARRSLEARGFILNPETNELLSANGELHVMMKDGVEYVLRFGNVAGEEEGSTEGKLNRYMFVTARLDETKLPQPELEPLPEDTASEPSEPAGSAEPAKPAEPAEPSVPENKDSQPSDPNESATPGECGQEPEADNKSDDSAAVKEEQSADKKASEAKDEEQPAEPPAADAAKPAAEEAQPSAKSVDAGAGKKPNAKVDSEDLEKKKREADRKRIETENERKLNDWKDKRRQAEEKVHEANARFADWYYVISEDVYKKLHLSRSDIIKESAKSAEEGTGLDAFRKLEQEGLKKKDAEEKK